MELFTSIIKMMNEALFPKKWDINLEGRRYDGYVVRQPRNGFRIFEGERENCEFLKSKAIELAAENGALSRKKLQKIYNYLRSDQKRD